jgi:hypothetical protein
VESTTDEQQVLRSLFLQIDLCESVEEGFGETFATATLLQRVLRCENSEIGVPHERLAKLGNKHGTSVIEDGVETFEDCLGCQVHFVEKDPIALLHGIEEGRVAPLELASLTSFHWQIRTEEVDQVGLVGKIDPLKMMPCNGGEGRDQAGLAYSRTAFEEDSLGELGSSEDPHGVERRSRSLEPECRGLGGKLAPPDSESAHTKLIWGDLYREIDAERRLLAPWQGKSKNRQLSQAIMAERDNGRAGKSGDLRQ